MGNIGITKKIYDKTAKIGVIGLGYVGLPLVIVFSKSGFQVTGFDVDQEKVDLLGEGKSYIKHIDGSSIRQCGDSFKPTSDFSKLGEMDCIIICVPTPLNKNREPDMTYVFDTARSIKERIRKGQLVVLESTTYPGTTDEDLKSIIEESGLRVGRDFYLAYSPEREDPNNINFSTSSIPKVVGGCTPACLEAARALYETAITKTVPVSSTRVAEASKLLENIYRAVNIALVNEMKVLFDKMDIDVWEVIEAAKTKPFGFQPFYPGPGLGGHCIPIDPFYLTWKAREHGVSTKFIELAGEINNNIPYFVIQKMSDALNERAKCIKGSRVLVLGISYKKNVDDVRESPALTLMELLNEKGALVDYNDPYFPTPPVMRHHKIEGNSIDLTEENLAGYDCVLIVTDHSCYDPDFIVAHSQLIVDTRHLIKDTIDHGGKVVRA